MKQLLSAYLKAIASTTMQGDAREESYYDSLKILFSDFPLEKGRKTNVTVLPKPTEAGNPDFRVWDGDHFIVGYIEAKTPGTNLDQVETSEQLERYLKTFPNVILTDFYEFRLYRDGQEVDRVTIARYNTAHRLRTTPALENIEAFEKLAGQFFGFKLPKTFTAESLAIELAKRTRFLRDQVVSEELKESEQGRGDIYGFYQAFKKYLISSLTPQQFADLYSQTITYGLFAARTRTQGDFNRRLAFDNIPQTIGILHDVFKFISLGSPSSQMEVIVDDIASVLNAAEISSILDKYYKEGKGEDPIVHFYETFLNQYDPETRERRGVYYTPEPVVKFIVRSVHYLLKNRFGLMDGLADPSVTVLDPAAGTLTFPAEAIKLAVKEYVGKYGEGGKKEFIKNQVLKNFYALELMMAPYAIGHMKMSFLLESLGYRLQGDDNFQLYLTNSLEMEDLGQIEIPGISSLSEESRLASKVKKDPILVIMGNPPYSVNAANANDWTERLLKQDLDRAKSYYKVDGKSLGERNPKMLQDDYVKFLRFAQWKIHKAGKGILAMITNHAYLDNPTFRGMRQSLLNTFDEFHILNLHGNTLKREKAKDGGKDENVFDIRQGVAIAVFIKSNMIKNKQILYSDLFGTRESKYIWLSHDENLFESFKEILPTPPGYFFIPRNTEGISHYLNWKKLNEIFILNNVGIVTSRDDFVIGDDRGKLKLKLQTFSNLHLSNDIITDAYNLKDTSSWELSTARIETSKLTDIDTFIKEIQYRPFDRRYIFYHKSVIDRMRFNVMNHMLEKDNIAILVPKRVERIGGWKNIFVTDQISEHVAVSSKTSDYHFPLFTYPTIKQLDWTTPNRVVNINQDFITALSNKYKINFDPENLFSYIYGILYSCIYRKTYEEFLKYDFPHIPFSANHDVFKALSVLGQRLIDLHLMKSSELEHPTVKYQGQGDNHTIATPVFDEQEKRVYINTSHYFEGVEPEVWKYQVGGYQVMDKYLKDRKGRPMDDPRHYIHIATALAKTIEIQQEIDAIYPEVEKDVIEF